MAMFPDSGVPPAEAKNSLPDVDTQGCDELWYSTSRCQPRFDPAAANAMLAEAMNIVMKGEVQYNCVNLNNEELAIRYLIQRGLPTGSYLAVGPNAYTTNLDPPLTRYNDFLTLIIVPNVDCGNGVTLDYNGKGPKPVLRNDGMPLVAKDLLTNRPALISYWSGAFYMVGLVRSQAAEKGVGSIDGWVRTDGNDTTGDGTENTAAKAFKTINGAFKALNSRYVQSPGFRINIRLGIPGTYPAATIGNASNTVTVTGDLSNPAGYRIAGTTVGPVGWNFYADYSQSVSLNGVTLLMDQGGTHYAVVTCARSSLSLRNVIWQGAVNNPYAIAVSCGQGSTWFTGSMQLVGTGSLLTLIWCQFATVADSSGGHTWSVSNVAFTLAGLTVIDGGSTRWGPSAPSLSGTSGPYYQVQTNGILYGQGQPFPGNAPGTAGTGGQVL